MPIQLHSLEELHTYLSGVIGRAEHHAPEVEEVILTLAGAVVLFKDTNTPLEAFSRRGSVANVLWATINGQRYAFSYDHDNDQIVIRRGSTQGTMVGSFSNRTSARSVIDLFERLQS